MNYGILGICIAALLFSFGMTPVQAQTLTHGPVVGAVTTNSAEFVYRVSAEADLEIEAAIDAGFTNPVFSTLFHTIADSDYFGKVAMTGLLANTLYYYRPVINSVPLEDGIERTFRTFPVAGTNTDFTFLVGSCQQAPSFDPNSRIGLIFNEMVDVPNAYFLIQQGDWGYPDTTDSEMGLPGNFYSLHWDLIQSAFRSHYTPDYPMINLLRRMSVAYTYDDHDMVDDNCDHFNYPWAAIQNIIRGEQTLFPIYPLVNPNAGVWHKFRCGDAEIFMTDNRAQRTPNLAGFSYSVAGAETTWTFNPPPTKQMLDGDPTVIPSQMDWLFESLLNSTATWKFISTGTMFNPGARAAIEMAMMLQHTAYDPVTIPGMGTIPIYQVGMEFADKWAGFPESIRRLIQFVADHSIENVILLTGDSHNSAIDDGANSIFPELMTSGLDITNSHEVAVFEQFGIYIWNKGGHTSNRPESEFRDSYGRVRVFGSDSVQLEVVDQGDLVLGRHTVLPGFLPDRVNLLAAPYGLNFGPTPLCGNPAVQAFVALSTSCDVLHIQDIVSSNPQFMLPPNFPTQFDIPSGMSQIVPVIFIPGIAGIQTGALLIFSNDPQSPQLVYLMGEGAYPRGTCDNPIILPGVHVYDTTAVTCCMPNPVESVFENGCSSAPVSSGPDLIYRFNLLQQGTLSISATSPNVEDRVQVMVFTDCANPAGSCEGSRASASNTSQISNLTLPAGIHYLSVSLDTDHCGPVSLHIDSDVLLPVEFGNLSALSGDGRVTLRWNTFSERNNDRFEILRNGSLAGHVPGQGTSSTEHHYEWIDEPLMNGIRCDYILKSVDFAGQYSTLASVSATPHEAPAMITEYALYQNFPNPFNPSTQISFDLKEAGTVRLTVFNMLGEQVADLVNSALPKGHHIRQFNAEQMPSGIYIYRLQVNGFAATRKMLLIR